jgi:hypothetical protein
MKVLGTQNLKNFFKIIVIEIIAKSPEGWIPVLVSPAHRIATSRRMTKMKNNFAKRRTFAISSIVSEIGVRRKLNV